MALQPSDIIVVQRPTTKVLYHCKIDDLTVESTDLASETQTGIVRLATLQEVIEGKRGDVAISPLNMSLAFIDDNFIIDGNSGEDVDYAEAPTSFAQAPISFTEVPAGFVATDPATETEAGIVRLATSVETTEGTDSTIAITPYGLRATLDDPSTVFDGGTY